MRSGKSSATIRSISSTAAAFGTSYYWDPAYLPEIWLVLPKEESEVDDIWFAGHSIWTYGLLSGGVIAWSPILVLFGATATFSLHRPPARILRIPGRINGLHFCPFIATCCLISETLTANPFQERLTGILFGMMAGLSQAFMVRALLDPHLGPQTALSGFMSSRIWKNRRLDRPAVDRASSDVFQPVHRLLPALRRARDRPLPGAGSRAWRTSPAALDEETAAKLGELVHFAIICPTGKRSFFNGRFEGDPVRTFARWKRAADTLADAEAATGMRADLVFFPYLDSYLRFLPFPVVPDAILHRPWSGLYLRNHHHGEPPSLRKILRLLAKGDAILRSKLCRGVGVLDERFIPEMEKVSRKNRHRLSGRHPGRTPAEPFPLALEIQRKAAGRKIIGMIGLERRKGFLTLIRCAALAREQDLPYYFVCAGASPPRRVFRKRTRGNRRHPSRASPPGKSENLHFDPDCRAASATKRITTLFSPASTSRGPPTKAFKAAAARSARPPLFEIPCLATAGECIGQRVDRYRLGLTIPEALANTRSPPSPLIAGTIATDSL